MKNSEKKEYSVKGRDPRLVRARSLASLRDIFDGIFQAIQMLPENSKTRDAKAKLVEAHRASETAIEASFQKTFEPGSSTIETL